MRYESSGDPGTALFNKGIRAEVTVRGEALPERATNTAATDSIRATGNEPPWLATVEGDQLTLITEYGATIQTAPVVNTHRGASVTRYRAFWPNLPKTSATILFITQKRLRIDWAIPTAPFFLRLP